MKNRIERFTEVVSEISIKRYNQKEFAEIVKEIANEFFEPEAMEDLIHVIDYKEDRIKAMDNFDVCDFVNAELACDTKRYLLVPNADAGIHVLEGGS